MSHPDPFASAVDLLQLLREREVSAVELLALYRERIERYDDALNAVVIRDFERAEQQAREADARRARGEDAPLLGLPMTIKDCIYVAGLPTTGGVVERAHAIAERDAPATAAVRAAGAVIMGKTNVPPYAADVQAWNPLFGRTNNPWDIERTPGGSSGGAAAALAAGLTALELGGDLAGSIRQPAAFSGVYGHKPSETAAPRTGHFPGGFEPNAAFAMAVQGPMARAAGDLALVMDLLAGPDVGEDVAWRVGLPRARHGRLRDYRVAFLPNPAWLELDDDIASAMQRLADELARHGATVGWALPDGFDDLREYHGTFLRVLFALTASTPLDERPVEAERLRATGDDVARAYADGLLASAQDYVGWFGRRERFRAAYRAFFREWDVLIAPCHVGNAFPHDARPMEERTLEINGKTIDFSTVLVHPGLCNLSGQPGTAFPSSFGRSREGLPIGLQAIGPYLEDHTPIHFAALLAETFGGFEPPPGYE